MKIIRHVIWYFLLIFPMVGFADSGTNGFGYVAQNLVEPVNVLSDFVSSASIIIGISFILGSFLRYLQYRVNPFASPLGTVIALLIMGIVLVCLPLAYKLTEGGIPYSYSIKI